jgi:hypothetical protein
VDVLEVDRDLRLLSSACYRGDGAEVVRVLAGRDPGLLLQQAGEGIMVALMAGTAGAATIAQDLIVRLAKRGWEGDAELAEQLSALTGGLPTGRRAAPAALDDLADLLEGGLEHGFGGLLDLTTGVCWPAAVVDDWGGDEEDRPRPDLDPDRWLEVPNLGSHDGWRDMADFIGTLDDQVGADRLTDAIDGRGAFSRFRRELDRHPELIRRWQAFSAECRVGRARSWLASQSYDALPATHGH